jgi:hypothetical protein
MIHLLNPKYKKLINNNKNKNRNNYYKNKNLIKLITIMELNKRNYKNNLRNGRL